ncbi:MAG: hypothetical protein K8R92_02860 [Planctomycetes bacterium]|nr:hypothetical protein [Planctomycetota bacterium]
MIESQTASPAAQPLRVDCEDGVQFDAALVEATGFRGDVTLELKDGTSIEGYVFDLKRGGPAGNAVRILPKDGRSRMTIPQASIRALCFTGKDAAAGKSWENWIKRYADKKLKGEAAGIESEPLE